MPELGIIGRDLAERDSVKKNSVKRDSVKGEQVQKGIDGRRLVFPERVEETGLFAVPEKVFWCARKRSLLCRKEVFLLCRKKW